MRRALLKTPHRPMCFEHVCDKRTVSKSDVVTQAVGLYGVASFRAFRNREGACTRHLQMDSALHVSVELLKFQIRRYGFGDSLALCRGRFTNDLARHTNNERIGRDDHPFSHNSAGADDAA